MRVAERPSAEVAKQPCRHRIRPGLQRELGEHDGQREARIAPGVEKRSLDHPGRSQRPEHLATIGTDPVFDLVPSGLHQ